jgi:Tat protein secretion system quality control protein TatD with DNase activity
MSIRLYDAHNHLQDARFASHREAILAAAQAEGVAGMVVNGSCEEDWPEVLALARRCHTRVAADVRACCPSLSEVGRAVLSAPRTSANVRNALVSATTPGALRTARPTAKGADDLGNTP